LSYYDDLGVEKTASSEEIREAYRTLVRLLHPDQQTDPTLKRAAEGQMRRINAIYAVLSDPEQRRRYDAGAGAVREIPSMAMVRAQSALVVRRRIDPGSLVWIGVAALSLGLIFWLAMMGQPITVRTAQTAVPVGKPQVPENSSRQLPDSASRPAPIPRAERSLQTEAAVPRANKPPDPLPMPPPDFQPPSVTAPELPAPAKAMPAPVKGFGGFWAYLHDQDFRQAGKYPPQFIETSIVEKDGRIRGRYKARYYVSDRPISPNVNFEFEGEFSGVSAKLPWRGDGGSQGQVEINLMSDNELEVIWHATDLGQSLGLASGRAILRRRPE
jgi:hypothetical protein